MGWRETVERILQRYSVGAADRLGGGEEAEASALGSERVIKFHERTIGRELVGRRREFYAALDSSRVAFRVPVIQRIEGISLAGVLPGLTGLARQRTLRAYAETALASVAAASAGQIRQSARSFTDPLAEMVRIYSFSRTRMFGRKSSPYRRMDEPGGKRPGPT
jgi:hypothetical protein